MYNHNRKRTFLTFIVLLMFGLFLELASSQKEESSSSSSTTPAPESSSPPTNNATSLIEVDVAANGTMLIESAITVVKAPKFNASAGSKGPKKSHGEDIDILPEGYYRDVAPMIDGKAVKVGVTVTILSIKLSSDSSQSFDADLFYYNYWTDNRLQKPTNEDAIAQRISLSGEESLPQYKLSSKWSKRIWVPDTYFRNAISGSVSNILTPTQYFTITNYTEVFMAVRMSMKMACHMNFAKFPFDSQVCFINISMTSEDINTVVLEWDTFKVGNQVDVTEFQITKVDHKECVKHMDIGVFSCLYGEIHFKRNIGVYLIKRFIPSFIIVLMTFMGFWIPTSVTPARTSLPITALLALIAQSIQSELNVSYVYALQVWNIMCVMFVFANLLEFAIALYVMHMHQKEKERKKKREEEEKNELVKLRIEEPSSEVDLNQNQNGGNGNGGKRPSKGALLWKQVKARMWEQLSTSNRHSSVDLFSRYLFPLAFEIFIIIFAFWVRW